MIKTYTEIKNQRDNVLPIINEIKNILGEETELYSLDNFNSIDIIDEKYRTIYMFDSWTSDIFQNTKRVKIVHFKVAGWYEIDKLEGFIGLKTALKKLKSINWRGDGK